MLENWWYVGVVLLIAAIKTIYFCYWAVSKMTRMQQVQQSEREASSAGPNGSGREQSNLPYRHLQNQYSNNVGMVEQALGAETAENGQRSGDAQRPPGSSDESTWPEAGEEAAGAEDLNLPTYRDAIMRLELQRSRLGYYATSDRADAHVRCSPAPFLVYPEPPPPYSRTDPHPRFAPGPAEERRTEAEASISQRRSQEFGIPFQDDGEGSK